MAASPTVSCGVQDLRRRAAHWAALNSAPWGDVHTHTATAVGHVHHSARRNSELTNTSTLQLPRRSQLLQRVRRKTTHIRRYWCRRDADQTRGAWLAWIACRCESSFGKGSAHSPAPSTVMRRDGDIGMARWMRRPGFAWLRRWTIVERAAFLARRLCEGLCVGFGWNVVVCFCVGVSVHGRAPHCKLRSR